MSNPCSLADAEVLPDRPRAVRTRPALTRRQLRIVLAFATVYVVWGSTYLAIRYAIETLPGFLMAGGRFVVAGTLLYAWGRARGAAAPSLRQWRASAVVGGLMLVGGNGGVVWAEQYVPSGLAALLVCTTPLWIALLDWWRPQGVRPGGRTWLGLLLGIGGMVLLVGSNKLLGGQEIHLGGLAVLAMASFWWASGSVYSRHAPLPKDPLLNAGMQMQMGGLLLLVVGTLAGEWHAVRPEQISSRSLVALAYLIVFGSLAGYTAYSWLVREVRPVWVSTYAFVNPMVAVLLGWVFAGEVLSRQTLLAGVVIVMAVALIITSRAESKGKGG